MGNRQTFFEVSIATHPVLVFINSSALADRREDNLSRNCYWELGLWGVWRKSSYQEHAAVDCSFRSRMADCQVLHISGSKSRAPPWSRGMHCGEELWHKSTLGSSAEVWGVATLQKSGMWFLHLVARDYTLEAFTGFSLSWNARRGNPPFSASFLQHIWL